MKKSIKLVYHNVVKQQSHHLYYNIISWHKYMTSSTKWNSRNILCYHGNTYHWGDRGTIQLVSKDEVRQACIDEDQTESVRQEYSELSDIGRRLKKDKNFNKFQDFTSHFENKNNTKDFNFKWDVQKQVLQYGKRYESTSIVHKIDLGQGNREMM